MDLSCCFTGHRVLKNYTSLSRKIAVAVMKLINVGVTDFYAGGAIGWDMLCAQTVITLRECFNDIKLHLVLPCPPEEQCKKWSDEQKMDYYKIYKKADSVEIVSDVYYKGCMRKRNKRLVELGDICVCYFDNKQRSGTAQTIKMAKEKGIRIINLY